MRIATFNLKDFFAPKAGEEREFFEKRTLAAATEITRSHADVILIQEAGGEVALGELAACLNQTPIAITGEPVRPMPRAPFAAIAGDVDERGIGSGILCRLPLLSQQVHRSAALPFPVFVDGDAPPYGKRLPLRRPFVEITFAAGELGAVTVITGHLKSNLPRKLRAPAGEDIPAVTSRERGEASVRAEVLRQAEALFLRELADAHLSARDGVMLLVGGDFNADAASTPLRLLGDERGPQPLFSAISTVPEHKRYTTLHNGRARAIDHMLMSTALQARLTRADIQNEALFDHGHRSGSGPAQLVESDHALYWTEFAPRMHESLRNTLTG